MIRERATIRLYAVLSGLTLAWACGESPTRPPPEPDPPRPTTLAVSPAAAELTALGATVQLTADVRDQYAAVMAGATVTWGSSDTSVATVDASGLVTGVARGVATITASAGPASGSAEVTVTQLVSSVEISPPAATIAFGSTLQLTAEGFDENGIAVEDAGFAWESSNATIATVDAGGLVTGVGEGVATITARAGDGAAMAEVTVGPDPAPAALEALYHATGGPNWVVSDNWLTDAPLGEWTGVGTDDTGRVVRLRLPWNNLTGPIPPELANLTSLEELTLDSNNLVGAIPPELASLASLTSLDVGGNALSGPIPPELGNLASLTSLWLGGNLLTGPIPPELANLTSLKRLALYSNRLTESIPPGLGNLAGLTLLRLGSNNLTGEVPVELGNLTALTTLTLSHNNLTGPVPASFLQLDGLLEFWFEANAGLCAPGTSEFVAWLQGIEEVTAGPYCSETDMETLERVHETSGGANWTSADGWFKTPVLEEWYGVTTDSIGRVVALDLADNGLEGRLPSSLGRLAALTILRVGGNALSGRLPRSLAHLDLAELHYAGTALCAPADASFQTWLNGIDSHEGTGAECGRMTDRETLEALFETTGGRRWRNTDHWLTDSPLREWHGVDTDAYGRIVGLDLSGNGLSGPVPPEVGNLTSLKRLELGGNDLSGSIPSDIGNLTSLTKLDLRVNDLSGPIPPEIGNLVQLRELDLPGNDLTDPIPPEIGNLRNLESARLNGNNLSGPIPPEVGNLTSLQLLWLDDNHLSGAIPPDIGGLTSLTHLLLVNNKLSGPVPPDIGRLASLRVLDLRLNDLAGAIPPELGDLASLVHLRLAGNELSGPIPPDIGKLPSLRELALDRNRLTGPIPREFENLANLVRLTVEDNTGLSGSLPADLVYLRHLDTLLAGGTDLCAPRDPGFQYWLRGIGRSSVAPCALPVGCDPNSPGPSISGAMRNRLPPFPPPEEWTINEIWADIARQVPGGWGGFFIGDDQPIHYLVHPERQDDALAALRELGVTSPFTTREPAVLQARWDFAQLYDWRTYIFVAVGWPDGLVSVDIDEFRNRLSYGVEDVEAAESLAAAFEAANLPCALTIIEVTGPVMAY